MKTLLIAFLILFSVGLSAQKWGEIAVEGKDATSASVPGNIILLSQALKFPFESFNLPNLGIPNLNWGSSDPLKPGGSFLTITSTNTAMRQMQFALKYNFQGGPLALWTAALPMPLPPLTALLRTFLAIVLHTLFRVRVTGAEHIPRTGPALLIANHVSYADAFLVGSTTPRLVRFLIWQRFYAIAVLRPFFQRLRTIPVPLGSPKQVLRALDIARAELLRGELVGIFPEGGLTATGELQPFERGIERLMQGVPAPVIPLYLAGLWGHPLSRHPQPRWWPLRRAVLIRIGPPLSGPVTAAGLHAVMAALGRPL